MDDLTKLSPIELQKKANDITAEHDALKKEIVNYTYELEKMEKELNVKVQRLQELEKNYVEIIEILNQ